MMPMDHAAAQVQRAYEGGDISYPRTMSRELSAPALQSLSTALMRHDIAFPMPVAASRSHAAIYPLKSVLPGIQQGVPQTALSADDALIDRLVRAWVRGVAPYPVEVPKKNELPDWAAALNWWRPAEATPWAAQSVADDFGPQVGMEVVDYSADEIAFRALLRERLGRPSSMVEHAVKAAERGFVDGAGLTDAGRRVVKAAPQGLQDVAVAQAMEVVLEGDWDGAGGEAMDAPQTAVLDWVAQALSLSPTLVPALRMAVVGKPEKVADDATTVATAEQGDRWVLPVLTEAAADEDWTEWPKRRKRALAIESEVPLPAVAASPPSVAQEVPAGLDRDQWEAQGEQEPARPTDESIERREKPRHRGMTLGM
jgi:hypothetical protein